MWIKWKRGQVGAIGEIRGFSNTEYGHLREQSWGELWVSGMGTQEDRDSSHPEQGNVEDRSDFWREGTSRSHMAHARWSIHFSVSTSGCVDLEMPVGY